MLENRSDQHKGIPDRYVDLTAAYTMKTYDQVVRVTATIATDSYTVTLPPVSLASGRFYALVARLCNSAKTVTIAHAGDSENWTNITFNGKGDRVLLYSDGKQWHSIANVAAGANTTLAPTTTAG
jgi:hypothetical protein